MGMGFVWTLFGVSGEESGWRGFLQPSLEKKHSVIKASVIVGIIWGFWHAPMWFIQEVAGWKLIQYILLYFIYIISGSVITGICYNRCKNLIVPIWLHFVCSYSLVPLTVGSLDISWLAAFYALAAIGYVIWYKKRIKNEVSTV
jgi:CAAX amino terminal protease family.